MTEFQLYFDGQWNTPPNKAKPSGFGKSEISYPSVIRRNLPIGRTGAGIPTDIDTELWAEIGREFIEPEGYSWYYDNAGLGTVDYKEMYVKLYDPETSAWTSYYGKVWHPSYDGVAAPYTLINFRVHMSTLIEATP